MTVSWGFTNIEASPIPWTFLKVEYLKKGLTEDNRQLYHCIGYIVLFMNNATLINKGYFYMRWHCLDTISAYVCFGQNVQTHSSHEHPTVASDQSYSPV